MSKQPYYQVGTRVYHQQTNLRETSLTTKKICRTSSARTTEEFFTQETIDGVNRWIHGRVELIDSILNQVQDYCVAITILMNDEGTAVVYRPTIWLISGIMFMRPPEVPFVLYYFHAGKWIELTSEDLEKLQRFMNGTSIGAADIIRIVASTRSVAIATATAMWNKCNDPTVHKVIDYCE
jgi:hypothetical protein